jgi:serine/threonine protein kinase
VWSVARAVGEVIDRRYELRREIARGGGGVVFEAHHNVTTRSVAIKLLDAPGQASGETRERLLREARYLTVCRHPGVVEALDAGITEEAGPYLVMELLEGRTLAGLLAARTRLPVTEVVRIGVELCDALDHCHARGILHRDIKPSNVFVAHDDIGRESVKVFDFGIASLPKDEVKLTAHGALLGTPEYMAPEQLLARQDVDHRCDVYAIGVTLYECLSGTVPHPGTFGEVLLSTTTGPERSVRDLVPGVPEALDAVLKRALSTEASARFESCREFARALAEVSDDLSAPVSLLGIRRGPGRLSIPTVPVTVRRGEEQRRFARAPYVTPVRIIRQDGVTLDGHSEDLSQGGLLVLARGPCENGELVKVRFALPMSGRIVDLSATARWVRRARGNDAVGLEFLDASAQVLQTIENYVALMGGTYQQLIVDSTEG